MKLNQTDLILQSLIVIPPVLLEGIRYPSETKFDNHLQDLEHSQYSLGNPLIPSTTEDMEDMLRLCSHVRFKIPQQVGFPVIRIHSTLCPSTLSS